MGVLSDHLELGHHYTNHCIHAIGMTLLNEQGFEARHICAMSSHKNESTIRSYAVQCPNPKKWEMSEALGSVLQPTKIPKVQENTPLPQEPMLEDIDWESDDMLVKVLEDIEKQNANLQNQENQENISEKALTPIANNPENAQIPLPGKSNILTVNNNMVNVHAPKIPMMYFLHSNVTINYNFHH